MSLVHRLRESGAKTCSTCRLPLSLSLSLLNLAPGTSSSGAALTVRTFNAGSFAMVPSTGSWLKDAVDAKAAELPEVKKPAVKMSLAARIVGWTVGTVLLTSVAGCAYVTQMYDTKTIRKAIESARSELTKKYNSSLEVVLHDSPSNSDVSKNSLIKSYSEEAKTALLKFAEAYVELREDLEERYHRFISPSSDRLLPDQPPHERQRVITLVLDLNDTLVHSDWRRDRGWRTFKRPGVEAFIERMSQYYEVVVFSDQINFSVDPIIDRLDPHGQFVRFRLYRDATQYKEGEYVKDLSKLNRDVRRVIYLTANEGTCAQKENVLPISKFDLEKEGADTDLLDLLPFLEFLALQRSFVDTRAILRSYEGMHIPTAFKERAKEYQNRLEERKAQKGFLRFGAASASTASAVPTTEPTSYTSR